MVVSGGGAAAAVAAAHLSFMGVVLDEKCVLVWIKPLRPHRVTTWKVDNKSETVVSILARSK